MPILTSDIDSNWPDGVLVTSTFDAWRKKTNGIINAYNTGTLIPNLSILPIKLSVGAPSWTSGGNVTITGTLGATAITGTSLSVGGGAIGGGTITGTSLVLGSGAITTTGTINGGAITGTALTASSAGTITGGNINGRTLTLSGGTGLIVSNGAINANTLAIGSTNTQFTVSAAGAVAVASTITATGAIVGASLSAGSGTITTTGTISGSVITSTGVVNANTLAIGSTNTQFTVSAAGAIVGTSLNAGSGTITTTGNAIAATPTLSTHLTTKGYVDNAIASNEFIPFAKAYCTIAAGTLTIRAMTGFATITRSSAGRYTVTFSSPQSNANYIVLLTRENAALEADITVAPGSKTINGFNIQNANDNTSAADPAGFHVVVIK